MASFAVLNEEKKILRRKEKELERQQKINAKIDEIKKAPVTRTVGKWADASDDEELMGKPPPISDTESESEHEAEQAPVVEESWENRETNGTKAEAAPASKKKEVKKQLRPEDEDLDAILGEMGIEIQADTQGGASGSKRNRKKKEKEEAGDAPAGGYPAAAKEDGKAKDAKPKEEKAKAAKASEEKGAEKENEEEKVVDEAARQAALEALKKKKAAAKKPAASDAAKLAAAEAKKRAEQKKSKKDKSMYDR